MDSFPTMSAKLYLAQLHSGSVWLCTALLSGESCVMVPQVTQK
jgi:hypothetical protein